MAQESVHVELEVVEVPADIPPPIQQLLPVPRPPERITAPCNRPFTRSQARNVLTGYRNQHDLLPEAPQPLPQVPDDYVPNLPGPLPLPLPQPLSRRRPAFRTPPDAFGRYRVYQSKPLTLPDADSTMAHLLPTDAVAPIPNPARPVAEIISPCPNISVFYVLRYHWLNGNTKSLDDRDYLCSEVLLQPDFQPRDLVGVSLRDIDTKLAEAATSWDPNHPPSQGWKNIPLRLKVPPLPVTKTRSAPETPHYLRISGFRARKLTDIVQKVFSSNNTDTFHYEPFQSRWVPPGATQPQTLAGEMYSSPAMLRAHREVQNLPIDTPGCTLPRCVAAFMFSSDGMQFASFSHVKGWPILCGFGNESKYERCKPLSNTCYQVAHIPSLPDEVKEQITSFHNGKPPSEALLTHLRRELMHAVWSALLDHDFIEAWKNGIVIDCADGVRRRVFPRILTYSANYPEKVLLAAIRNGGNCLCPRCLVQKDKTSQMGTPSDMRTRKSKRRYAKARYRTKIESARSLIYEQGRAIQSKPVEDLLKEESYVPTMNAFVDRLQEFKKFDFFSCLVVDQLHEVELGVWKALFKHLVRLLHLNGTQSVIEFNQRFRQIPTFASTIRLFADDVASAARIAARDFEDILQCCIPVFEGLLPDSCDNEAQKLLFTFAKWHGLAKLRLHTEDTLQTLRSLTTVLGIRLREFSDLTADMDVKETPQEYARRWRQHDAAIAKSKTNQTNPGTTSQAATSALAPQEAPLDGLRHCVLNLNTYKTHALADYEPTIREYGTTDSYSTQIGELQNRKIKEQYMRTNRRQHVEQMTRIADITTVLEDMDAELEEARNGTKPGLLMDTDAYESLLNGNAYHIGQKDRSKDLIPNVALWVSSHKDDPAVKFFLPQLKQHLLARILGNRSHPNFNEPELVFIKLHNGLMYRHNTLRVHYTSYDVLRQQDSMNPSTSHCFAMLARTPEPGSDHNAHPFIYAKILGIYHARVSYRNSPPKRMEFVHVRWLYYDDEQPGGWDFNRLDRIGYQKCLTDQEILDSFDFVDPSDIIRATHLLQDFKNGQTTEYIPHDRSIAFDDENGDWNYYYVNRFVDRDMLMRYLGGGIGHYQQHSSENTSDIFDTLMDEIEDAGIVCEEDTCDSDGENEDDSEDNVNVLRAGSPTADGHEDDDLEGVEDVSQYEDGDDEGCDGLNDW